MAPPRSPSGRMSELLSGGGGGGGSGWGKLRGDAQVSPTVLSSTEDKNLDKINEEQRTANINALLGLKQQGGGDSTRKSKWAAMAKRGDISEEEQISATSGGSRRSVDQNDAILGVSFAEFKSEIKRDVSEVHCKISNMEDLLKNILHRIEN